EGASVWKPFYLNASTHALQRVNGSCGIDTESVRILWQPNASEPAWSLEFLFKRLPSDNPTGQFTLDKVLFNYTVSESLFPETNETTARVMSVQDQQFKAPVGSYFQCMSKQTWKLADVPDVSANRTKTDVFLSDPKLRVEGFVRTAVE
ncbi:hypothetical protein FBUS_06232, partial [Fasciolopsis buskii]